MLDRILILGICDCVFGGLLFLFGCAEEGTNHGSGFIRVHLAGAHHWWPAIFIIACGVITIFAVKKGMKELWISAFAFAIITAVFAFIGFILVIVSFATRLCSNGLFGVKFHKSSTNSVWNLFCEQYDSKVIGLWFIDMLCLLGATIVGILEAIWTAPNAL